MRTSEEIRQKLIETDEFVKSRDGDDIYHTSSVNHLVLEVAKQRQYILKWVLGEIE